MTAKDVLDLMDAKGWGPLGECAFCGDGDARHRVVDAILERVAAGENEAAVLADYGLDR